MVRFFVDPAAVSETTVMLMGGDLNHMKNVLRMRIGEEVSISDGTGLSYRCSVREYKEDTAVLEILEKQEADHELPSEITLFQGLPKSDKLELVIQKAVELGVHRITPVEMKRCVVKWDAKKAENRLKRYNAISESAAKQSKRDMIPEVTDILTYKKALEYAAENCDILLVPYENAEGMEGTRRIIEGIEKGRRIGVFIGPEGGFEDREIEEAREAGAEIITLGKRILRTETAGLTILSILMYHLQ